MKIAMQKKGGFYRPYSIKDHEASKAHKENQIVVGSFAKVKHYRSLKQMAKYFIICRIIAHQLSGDHNWNTEKKVDQQCRMELKFWDDSQIIVKGNQVIVFPMSISFENLAHAEACFYFDRAFEFFAHDILKVTVEELFKMELPK
ncbi:MAG: hypothetical protein GY714_03900 [Desulfobacterales bacterium]|nr:hypothetical protein [Desulfobacterales bacterium]